MAPLPEEATNRLLVNYRVNGTDRHVLTFRFPDGVESFDGLTVIHDALTAGVASFYTDTVFESARWGNGGDKLTFPLAWTPITGTASTGSRPADFRARFFSMLGRDILGHNWRLSFFGATLVVDPNFLILDTEAPALADLRASFLEGEPPTVTIGKGTPIPLNYFTNRVSAYWQRKIARNG